MYFFKEVKVSSPDYIGVDEREAYNDFIARIHHYETFYETIDLDLEG